MSSIEAASALEAVFLARVRRLSIGFFLIFAAFSAGQLLQSTLNGSSGFACLIGIYLPFGLTALVAPLAVGTFGPTPLLPLAAAGYVVFVAANVVGGATLLVGCVTVGVCAAILWSSQGTYLGRAAGALAAATGTPLTAASTALNGSFFTLFMASGGVSSLFAAGVLAAAAGAGAEGVAASARTLFAALTVVGAAGVGVLATLAEPDSLGPETSAPPACLRGRAGGRVRGRGRGRGRADGGQARVGAGEGAAQRGAGEAEHGASDDWDASVAKARGTAGGSGAPQAGTTAAADDVEGRGGTEDDSSGDPTRVAPGAAAATAYPGAASPSAAAAAAAAAIDEPLPAPPAPPSVLDMLAFLARERRLHLFAPAIIFSGAGQGFVMGGWIAACVGGEPGLGALYVALYGAAYSFVSSACVSVWRRVAAQPRYGRAAAFAATLAVQGAWLVLMGGWLAATRVGSGEPARGVSPSASAAVSLAAVVVFATVDAVWNAFTPATLQVFFPGRAETPCAMASIRLLYSAGFSGQSAVSLALGRGRLAEQCALLAAALAVAAGSMWHLHTHVQSLDGVRRGAGGSSSGSAPAAVERGTDVARGVAVPAAAAAVQ